MKPSALRVVLVLLILAVPTMFQLGMYAVQVQARKNLPVFRIPIGGYDPSDMIRGRYIQFRFEWPQVVVNTEPKTCTYRDQEKCGLCLTNPEPEKMKVKVFHMKDDLSSCVAVIPDVNYSEFRERPDQKTPSYMPTFKKDDRRFYVPESAADRLDEIFSARKNDFAVRARVAKDGAILLDDLLIDDMPYTAYLKKNP